MYLNKIKLIIILGGLFFTVFATHDVLATTYYVDATGGSNANDGLSELTAWQTLPKINSTAFLPGDSILFKRGETFTGFINANDSGADGNPVIYDAYGIGAKPIIDATGQSYALDIQNNQSYINFNNLSLQNGTGGQVLILNGGNNIRFDSLDMSGTGSGLYILSGSSNNIDVLNTVFTKTGINTNIINIQGSVDNLNIFNTQFIDGNNGISFQGSSIADTVIIEDSIFTSQDNHGIHIESDYILDNGSISNSSVSTSTLGGIFVQGSLNNFSVLNSSFDNNMGTGFRISPVSGKQVINLDINDTTANNNGGLGFQIQGEGTDLDINNSDAIGNTSEGLSIRRNWSDVLVQNSDYTNNSVGISLVLDDISAVISNINFDSVSANNNTGNGVQIFGAVGSGTDVTLNEFTASSNGNDGINVKGNWSNINIFNCTAEDNGTISDGDGITYHSSTNGTIKYCTIRNNAKSAFAHVEDADVDMMYNILSHATNGTTALAHLEGTGNFKFYNNVVYSDAQVGNGIEVLGTAEIKNNIVYGFDIGILNDGGTIDGDYNNVFNFGTRGWDAVVQGGNSIVTDPLFVDTSNLDFSLMKNSPAIDSGVLVGEIRDFVNNLVPQGIVTDIGAFEIENTLSTRNKRGSRVTYACKDPDALNYSRFGRHKQSKCEFSSTEEKVAVLATETFSKKLFNGQTCGLNQILTQNLTAPSRNGYYSNYTGGIVTEARILQEHLNRLGFDSGIVDGWIGPITKAAIQRIQTYLGTEPDGYVGPITRSLINASC